MGLDITSGPRHLLSRATKLFHQAANGLFQPAAPWHLPYSKVLATEAGIPFHPEREDIAYFIATTFRRGSLTCSAHVLIYRQDDPINGHLQGQVMVVDPTLSHEIVLDPAVYRSVYRQLEQYANPRHPLAVDIIIPAD